MLSLKDFNFEYPNELVAQKALEERDQSRLLILNRLKAIEESIFYNICDYIDEGSMIVFNDSRVIPARIASRFDSGGYFELFFNKCLHTESHQSQWEILGKPLQKLMKKSEISFEGGISLQLRRHEKDQRLAVATINQSKEEVIKWLIRSGSMPLPPYIQRERKSVEANFDDHDKSHYQTIYSKELGSVAAPTAGLHFTQRVIDRLSEKKIRLVPITLHVGAGTFFPVQSEVIADHQMHEEFYTISKESWEKIIKAKIEGKSIIGVGTTSLRAIESFVSEFGEGAKSLDACGKTHATSLFIYPRDREYRYKPRIFSGLITNFHQPCSTLFMLICSLIGFEEAKKFYVHAIEKRFRLFSYGDSSLLYF